MPGSLQLEPLDAAGWAAHAPAFLDWNYRQSWAFARATAARLGAECEHLAIRRGGDVVGLASVRTKRVPLLGGIAFVSRRPSGAPGQRRRPRALRGGSRGAPRGVRAAPRPRAARRGGARAAGLERGRRQGRWRGRGSSRRPRATPTAPCASTSRLPPKSSASASRRSGGTASTARSATASPSRSSDGVELLEAFCALFEGLPRAQGFRRRPRARVLPRRPAGALAAERFTVTLARKDGRIVAGHVASHLGDTAVYLLGAADEVGRETQAAYLLQWHAILEAVEGGACAPTTSAASTPKATPGFSTSSAASAAWTSRPPVPTKRVPPGLAGRLPLVAERGVRSLA